MHDPNEQADREGADPRADSIHAVVRDPETVYVHWRLEGPRSRAARRTLGEDCQWFLRVLDLSEGTSRKLRIDPSSRSYYVEVTPGSTYGFELAASSGGRWRPICRTDRVEIPPGRPEAGAPSGPHTAGAAVRGLDKLRPPKHRTPIAGLNFESTVRFLGASFGPGSSDLPAGCPHA